MYILLILIFLNLLSFSPDLPPLPPAPPSPLPLSQSLYIIERNDVGEDPQVKQLAFDLRSVEMVMAGVLTPEKLRCGALSFHITASHTMCTPHFLCLPSFISARPSSLPVLHRYLFDGMGHLVASIFIGSTEHMRKINTNGVKKM